MPLTKHTLDLSAEAPSVKLARVWVAGILRDIGREDLIDSAQLGVTELVTNAIIHADPPLAVRMRGTVEHPRIEIRDNTPVPPKALAFSETTGQTDGSSLTTFGRGLALVSMASRSWGAHLDHNGDSKVVWFVPTSEIGTGYERVGDVFEVEERPLRDAERVSAHDHILVTLMDVPVPELQDLRRYHYELRREMRLLSLASPERYPLAQELTDTFHRSDEERRDTIGMNALDKATEAGDATVELQLITPNSTPATMARMQQLLDQLYLDFSEEDLLLVRPEQHLLDLQQWYFAEYTRQAAGRLPIPWSGGV